MKKSFLKITSLAMLGICFFSCDGKDEKKCWKITYRLKSIDFQTAIYASESEVDAQFSKFENFKKEVFKKTSESDCLFVALNYNSNENEAPQDDKNNDELIPETAHDYVDLGLSINWATCNIGANKPEDYGEYYAWGETSVQQNLKYDFSSYQWSNPSLPISQGLTKYCWQDNKSQLENSDDVARVKWGGTWRMPTKWEFDELVNRCVWEWSFIYGGYFVEGRNGNRIFLPAAGFRWGGDLNYSVIAGGQMGSYWSSQIVYGDYFNAFLLQFSYWDGEKEIEVGTNERAFGYSVRPVREK